MVHVYPCVHEDLVDPFLQTWNLVQGFFFCTISLDHFYMLSSIGQSHGFYYYSPVPRKCVFYFIALF